MRHLAEENTSYSTHQKLQWPTDQLIINFYASMADPTDLGFFSLLARQPSLAAAAQALGVTPPAVSRRLAALEKRLGVRLLNRTTRRLSLTPEGEKYLEDGEQILRDIERLERSLTESRDTPRGLLRINAGFGFGRRHLGPLISDFVRSYPEVDVVLHLSDRALDLTEHALDIAIRFGPPPDAHILARKIAANRRLLCAAPAYLAERGRPAEPRDLQGHSCIVIRESNAAFNNWQLADGKQQVMIKVRSPLAVNHGEIAVDWALAGHGIVLRSEWDIAGYLRSGELVRVLEPWVGSAADIHAIYPQRHQLSAKVRIFIDFLAERFAAYRADDTSRSASW